MGFTCMHLWRREYPTRRHYHSYQVPNWFRASIWLFSHSTAGKCKLQSDLARLWMYWNDIGWNSSIHVYREWMGVSLATIGIQWSAGCTIECILERKSSLPHHIIGVLTKNRAVYFFSNYYERVVYKVVNDEVPLELSDLFIDGGACLKGCVCQTIWTKFNKINKCRTSSAAMETTTHSRSSTTCLSICPRRTTNMY